MRVTRWTFWVLVLLLAPGIALAQGGKKGRKNAAQARENAKEEQIDQLADQVFNQADGNHNHVLGRSEQSTADELLQNGIMSLVQQGVLGMPQKKQKKQGKNQVPVQAPNGAAVFGAPTSTEKKKAKGISLTEFKAYAHAQAQQADADWAAKRAAQGQGGGKGRRRGLGQQNMAQQPPAP